MTAAPDTPQPGTPQLARPAPAPEPELPPDRSLELADRSYHMVDYTWFRVRHRLPELAAPHYLGRGRAVSPRYTIREVRQTPMPGHVLVKVSLTPGGAVGRSPGGPLWQVRPGEAILRFVEQADNDAAGPFWECYHPGHRGPWEFLGLILNGQTAAVAAGALIRRHGHIYRLGLDHLLIRRLELLARAPDHVRRMSAAEGLRLAEDVTEALLAAAEAGDVSRGRSAPELALAAEASLRNDLARPWTVAELAERHDVSREHLTRTFRRRHGVPPHQFLLELRLQEASRRLRGGPEPIKRIAFGLGFGSHASFVRAFRRHHGVTPSRYREQRGGE